MTTNGITDEEKRHTDSSGYTELKFMVSPESISTSSVDSRQLQYKFPDEHVCPNTKISNKLNSLIGQKGMVSVGKKKRNDLLTYCSINPVNDSHVDIPESFTEFDRVVQDAVSSIWEYGNGSHVFTTDMLYRVIVASSTARPSSRMKEQIEESLEKQYCLVADIDATDEVNACLKRSKKPCIEKACYNDRILSLKRITIRNGMQYIKGYQINSEPILLSYAKETKKILTTKSDLLDIKKIDAEGNVTSERLSNSYGHVLIKQYLWRRIMIMRRDEKDAKDRLRKYVNRHPDTEKSEKDFRNQQRVILFRSTFDDAGIATTNRAVQKRNRDYIFQVLDFWKAKNFITNYEVKRGERNTVTGVHIIF